MTADPSLACRPSLAVAGSPSRFSIRRVFCVGRNYADHAREMGHDPDREPPFFFMKPADAIVAAIERMGTTGVAADPFEVPYPPQTGNLHHEVELVVAIGSDGASIPAASALNHVWGYACGVDLTRRDLQDEAKAARRPWDLAKGFDASGPCSPLVPVSPAGHPSTGRIWLSVDSELRQEGDLADQIWPVADVIAHLSRSVTLRAGDLLFTGTPSGVGPLVRGNRVAAGIAGVATLEFDVV